MPRPPSPLLALLALGLVACSAEPLPPVQLEREHVRLRAEQALYCEGNVDWLEHHYRALSGFLGVSLPPGQKVDAVVLTDPDALAEACGAPGIGIDGCSEGTRAYSFAAFHPHELVHAYASLLGDPPFFFQEGLAEVIGCGDKATIDPPQRPAELRDIMPTSAFRALSAAALTNAYRVAADLTRHMIDTYGREAYLGFYAAMSRYAGLDAIDAAARAHLGQRLDDVLAGFDATPSRPPGEVCLRVAECAAAPLDVAGAPLACGTGAHPVSLVIPNLPALVASVPVGVGEGLRFHGGALPPVSATLATCDGSAPTSIRLAGPVEGGPFELWLDPPAADYAWTAWQTPRQPVPPDARDDARLSLARVASTTQCSGESHLVSSDTRTITVVGDLDWPSAAPTGDGLARSVYPFTLEQDTRAEPLISLRQPRLEGRTAYVCSGGCPEDDGATCAAVDIDPAVPYVPFLLELPGGEPLYLVIDGEPGPQGFEFGLRL